MAEFEPILKSRRYVLGETVEYYGIWDQREGRGPFERFPLTAEGFDAAERRFHRLNRTPRFALRRVAPFVQGVTVIGVLLWLLAGLFYVLQPVLPVVVFGRWYQWAFNIGDVIGYRLALGGILLLLALQLVARIRRGASASGSGEASIFTSATPYERALLWVAGIGLSLWIAVGLVTRALEPTGVPLFPEDPEPSLLFTITQVIESFAFRSWVAAVVVLALGWTRSSLRERPR